MRYLLFLVAAIASAPAAEARKPEAIAGCTAALAYSEANKGLALLVLREGQVVCRSKDVETPQEIWSGTKSLVGLMAAAAVQDKLLTLDERAADTLAEWRDDPAKSTITLRQLLNLSSGQPSAVGRPQSYADSIAIPLSAAPGTRFQYGPAPFQAFGEVMRRKLVAAGQDGSPRTYIERRILNPLGVRVGDWREGPDGNPLMPQGLVLAAAEWAKIGEFVRAGGVQGGTALVDRNSLTELFKSSDANAAYGLTWWLPHPSSSKDPVTRTLDVGDPGAGLPADLVIAAGAGDQRLYVIPSKGLTIVRQAQLDVSALLSGQGSGWSDKAFLKLLLGS